MSLDWNITNIEDHKTKCWRVVERDDPMRGQRKGEFVLAPVTDALIWATMAVGIGQVNAANAPEFYARIHLYERLHGAFLRTHDTETDTIVDRPITLDDVRDHVGLDTNASFSVEPRAKWLKRVTDRDMDGYARKMKDALDAAGIAAPPAKPKATRKHARALR